MTTPLLVAPINLATHIPNLRFLFVLAPYSVRSPGW